MASKLSYCGDLVRQHDPDRFLLSMLMPAQAREGLWALFAFNYEIAKTRETVSETQLGLIRLQWWREAVEKIYQGEEPQGSEVLSALAEAIRTYDLPHDLFDALIYAREFDLEDVLPGNLEGLVNYADFTSAPLVRLAVQVCGGAPEAEPIQPIATSYALIGVLRAAVFHARQRRCYLPEDLMAAHGVSVNQLYELKPQEGLPEVVKAVCEALVLDAAPENKLLKSMQKLTKIYAGQLKACKYDVFSPKMALPPPFKALRLFLPVM